MNFLTKGAIAYNHRLSTAQEDWSNLLITLRSNRLIPSKIKTDLWSSIRANCWSASFLITNGIHTTWLGSGNDGLRWVNVHADQIDFWLMRIGGLCSWLKHPCKCVCNMTSTSGLQTGAPSVYAFTIHQSTLTGTLPQIPIIRCGHHTSSYTTCTQHQAAYKNNSKLGTHFPSTKSSK